MQDAGDGCEGNLDALISIQSDPRSDGQGRRDARQDTEAAKLQGSIADDEGVSRRLAPRDAKGPATPDEGDARGDRVTRRWRQIRPCGTPRKQTATESTEVPYGTAEARAQTLTECGLRDFRVPFVSVPFSVKDLTPLILHLFHENRL